MLRSPNSSVSRSPKIFSGLRQESVRRLALVLAHAFVLASLVKTQSFT